MPPKAATTKPGPKPRRKVAGKPYLIYSADNFELKFVAESKGANGDVATLNAVKSGDAPAGVHLVALPKSAVGKRVQVDPEEREPVFKISRPTAKRKYTRRAKPGPKPKAATSDNSATDAKPARKKPGPKPGTKRTAAKAPTITSGNPFA